MDYKQKYEQALEYMRTVYPTLTGAAKEDVEHHFPELKDGEEKKSKKWILEYLYDGLRKSDVQFKDQFKAAIAWLEKQGEQTPSDKVEPKFKVGDWVRAISSGNIFKILSVNDGLYRVLCYDGVEANYPIEVEKDLAYWTIKDAKAGDVLYLQHDGVEHVIIYKGLVKKNFSTVLSAYCAYNGCVNDFCFADVSSYASITSERDEKEFYPATKEQRDFLFQKMHEAGYEWDTEKKELKKIEPKPAENKGMNLVEEEMTPFQKKVFFIIDTAIEEEQGLKQVCDELLRLAHYEIMQNPAWSEEDEWKFSDILALLRGGENFHYNTPELFDWLKSLKDRYTWKPSDEQMEALLKLEEMHVLEHEKNQENAHLYMAIKSLKEQLWKLKGEII